MQRQSPARPHPYMQKRGKQKIIIGITGSFGSGKSTVAKMFASYGAKLINADRLAHRAVAPGTKAYKKITGVFGSAILKKDKRVDRKKLAGIVFDNKNLLKKLNAIIHPEVIRGIKKQIKASRSRVVILDVPLLIEAGLEKIVDKLIVVKITNAMQIKRIQNKTSLSKKDILKRIKSQIPLRLKEQLADFIIDNDGAIEETKKQVEQIRRQWWKN